MKKIIENIKNLFRKEKPKPIVFEPLSPVKKIMDWASLIQEFNKIDSSPQLIMEFEFYDRYGEKYVNQSMNSNLIKIPIEMFDLSFQLIHYNNIIRPIGHQLFDVNSGFIYTQMQSPVGNKWTRIL